MRVASLKLRCLDAGFATAATAHCRIATPSARERRFGWDVFVMALVDCAACGQRISEAASACPHCGHPARPVPHPAPAAPVYVVRTRPVVIPEDPIARKLRLSRHLTHVAWCGIPVTAILVALGFQFCMMEPQFSSENRSIGILVNDQPSEVSGDIDVIFGNSPSNAKDSAEGFKAEARKFYPLSKEDQNRLVEGATVELPEGFTAKLLDTKVEEVKAPAYSPFFPTVDAVGYKIWGRWALTPPRDFPEGRHKIFVALPGIDRVRDRIQAATPNRPIKILLYPQSYSSRLSLYGKMAPMFVVSLLACSLGVAFCVAGFVQDSRLGYLCGIGSLMCTMMALMVSMTYLNGRAGLTLRVLMEHDEKAMFATLLVVYGIFFCSCWSLAGDLRWSRLWAMLVLPSMILPLWMAIHDVRNGGSLDYVWLPVCCLPGQFAALATALARIRPRRPAVS